MRWITWISVTSVESDLRSTGGDSQRLDRAKVSARRIKDIQLTAISAADGALPKRESALRLQHLHRPEPRLGEEDTAVR